jgi:hypothetical protein
MLKRPRLFLFSVAAVGLFTFFMQLPLNVAAQSKKSPISYKFRLLTQGASAFAPASRKNIKLQFTKSPQLTLSGITNSQGIVSFSTKRCNDEDTAELIYRSDFADKELYRVKIDISCGTEDSPVKFYDFGIFSLTYGKRLAADLDGLEGPCYKCKN